MAICLPGMPSRVKRAATSATRPDPAVMTTNWMMIRMRKTTRPTTMEPPITKWPKLDTTTPAYPCSRTWRVTATLRARRNMVATRISVGNTEKSSGRFTCMAVRSTSTDPVMFAVISRSIRTVGSGMTRTTTTPTTESGTAIRVACPHRPAGVGFGASQPLCRPVGSEPSACIRLSTGDLSGSRPSLDMPWPAWPILSTSRPRRELRGRRVGHVARAQLAIVWTSRKARAVGDSE